MAKQINEKMAAYKHETKAFRKAVKRAENNAIVRAENLPGNGNGFGVYLDFAGESNLLVVRRSGSLYTALKDGVSLGELRRWSPRSGRRQHRLSSQIGHIVNVVDEEIEAMLTVEPDNRELQVSVYVNGAYHKWGYAGNDFPLAA